MVTKTMKTIAKLWRPGEVNEEKKTKAARTSIKLQDERKDQDKENMIKTRKRRLRQNVS